MWAPPVVGTLFLIGVSQYSFLAFHTLAELFTVIVSYILFSLAWSTRGYAKNNFLLFLAYGYFWIGSLDLLHTFVYKGMDVLVEGSGNLAVQFWIGTRYFEALVLLVAPFMATRKHHGLFLTGIFGGFAVALTAAIFLGFFPVGFVAGQGLTDFKVYSEYVIIGMLALALLVLVRHGDGIALTEKKFIAVSIVLTVAAELFFTLYLSVYGLSNLVGHIFKLFSFWFLFQAVFIVNVKKPYAAIQASEEKLRTTLQSIGDAVIVTDQAGHITMMNPVAEQLCGYDVAQVVGQPISDKFHIINALTRKPVANPVTRVLASGVIVGLANHTILISADGTEYQIADSAAPIFDDDGTSTGVVLVFRDVSQDYAMREALVQSEQNYRGLFENSEISVWHKDLSQVFVAFEHLRRGGVTHLRPYLDDHPDVFEDLSKKIKTHHVNEATLMLFGALTQEVFLRHLDEVFGPDGEALFMDELCAIWDQKAAFRSETILHTLAGDDLNVIVSFHIPKTRAAYRTVPVSMINITDYKRVERSMRNAKKDAEKANRAKSEFLASMSHELRTPLNAVLGFAQMLKYTPQEPLSETQNEYVENILDGGNHLLELVNETLDLAQVEADQLNLSLSDVNANTVISDCVSMISPLGLKGDVRIVNLCSSFSDAFIFTDSTRFKQILINLLSNGVKFNKEGGTVTIRQQETDYGYLRISVTDTGIGIAENDQNNVFRLFHRLDADPMVAREGTGIGLTVTKLLVDRLAGRIGIQSEEGVGSTFWVDFPLSSNEDVLIWTESMRTGIDPMDKDHQVLIGMLNRILRRSVDEADVDDTIDEMWAYARYHFKREKIIMDVCKYPDQHNHLVYHQDIVDDIGGYIQAWKNDKSQENLDRLRNLLKNWLSSHILDEDTKITPYAQGKEEDIKKHLYADEL